MAARKDPHVLAAVRAYYKAFMDPREIQVKVATDFGLSERTVRRYLAAVELAAANERTPEQRSRRWNQMYATARAALMKCIAAGDHRAADRWAERICKMEGMYVDRVELSGPNGAPITTDGVQIVADLSGVKSADRRSRLQELLARATAGKKVD